MDFLVHIAANAVLGAFFIWGGVIRSFNVYLLFICFAVLIDLDHIIFHIFSQRTFHIKKMIPVMKKYRERMEPHLYIFHSPEFLFITALLALSHPLWGLLLASNLLHLSMDTLEHYLHKKNFDEFRAWSISLAVWRTLASRKAFK